MTDKIVHHVPDWSDSPISYCGKFVEHCTSDWGTVTCPECLAGKPKPPTQEQDENHRRELGSNEFLYQCDGCGALYISDPEDAFIRTPSTNDVVYWCSACINDSSKQL